MRKVPARAPWPIGDQSYGLVFPPLFSTRRFWLKCDERANPVSQIVRDLRLPVWLIRADRNNCGMRLVQHSHHTLRPHEKILHLLWVRASRAGPACP